MLANILVEGHFVAFVPQSIKAGAGFSFFDY